MKTISSDEGKSEPDLISKLSEIYHDLMKMMIEEKDYGNFLNFFITERSRILENHPLSYIKHSSRLFGE